MEGVLRVRAPDGCGVFGAGSPWRTTGRRSVSPAAGRRVLGRASGVKSVVIHRETWYNDRRFADEPARATARPPEGVPSDPAKNADRSLLERGV